jgi:hypothetical protein
MGKHETRYARIERDLYPTLAWLIAALAEHVDFRNLFVWECACGDGRMSEALKLAGCARVYSTDIAEYGYAGQDEILDFLAGWNRSCRHDSRTGSSRILHSASGASSPRHSSKPGFGT